MSVMLPTRRALRHQSSDAVYDEPCGRTQMASEGGSGSGSETNSRATVGLIPVEKDASVRFKSEFCEYCLP